MSRVIAEYALVRLMPNVDSGEFANIGIIMSIAERTYFDFSIALNMPEKVSAFFPDFSPAVYRKLSEELLHKFQQIKLQGWSDNSSIKVEPDHQGQFKAAFAELITKESTLVQFSESRQMVLDNIRSLDDLMLPVDALFQRYVGDPNIATEAARDFFHTHRSLANSANERP